MDTTFRFILNAKSKIVHLSPGNEERCNLDSLRAAYHDRIETDPQVVTRLVNLRGWHYCKHCDWSLIAGLER